MMSKASSQLTDVNSPFSSKTPFFFEQRRSQPVAAIMILDRKALDAVETAIDLGQRIAVGGERTLSAFRPKP